MKAPRSSLPRVAVVLAAVAGLAQVVAVGIGPALAGGSASAATGSATASTGCQRPARAFVPVTARIPAIGRSVQVVVVKRTRDNAVGAVPTNEAGKWLMSMDPQARPGGRRGSILLAGHTWPDGSALGNAMLRDLEQGHRIVLVGKAGQQACYRVTRRVSFPVHDVPARKAFRADGPERIVIVACSGTRLGPGNWSRRTLWYATPDFPKPAAPPPPATTPSNSGGGTLLGGLFGGLLGGG